MKFFRPLTLITAAVALLAHAGSAQATFTLTVTGPAGSYSETINGTPPVSQSRTLFGGGFVVSFSDFNLPAVDPTTNLLTLDSLTINTDKNNPRPIVQSGTYVVTLTEDNFTQFTGVKDINSNLSSISNGTANLVTTLGPVGGTGTSARLNTVGTSSGLGAVTSTPPNPFTLTSVYTVTVGDGTTFQTSGFSSVSIHTPAPASIVLLGAGLPFLGLVRLIRRRKGQDAAAEQATTA
jgi:hypothetical protein